MKEKRKNFKEGFTLLEFVVALGIFSLIILFVVNFQKDVFVLNNINRDSLHAQTQGHNVLRNIVPELREASPSSLGAYPINQVSTSSLKFYSDIDDDQLKEEITYYLSDDKLMKSVIKPTGDPLIYDQNVEEIREIAFDIANSSTTPIFEYFDTNYNGSSTPLTSPVNMLSIRLIKINLIIDKNAEALPTPIYFSSQVSVRNLKDNL